jgi:hypothetical protein
MKFKPSIFEKQVDSKIKEFIVNGVNPRPEIWVTFISLKDREKFKKQQRIFGVIDFSEEEKVKFDIKETDIIFKKMGIRFIVKHDPNLD